MTPTTPIAVFTYNRPAHTQRVLESLANCACLDRCKVFLYSDGAKNESDAESVRRTRAIVDEFAARLNANVIRRDRNMGLAKSIVSGVAELSEQFGRVIVLEDDFVVSPDFLRFMLYGLDRYEHEESVYQLSGFMFPVTHISDQDAFFMPLATTWGWATWNRAWRVFDWNAEGASYMLNDSEQRRRFNLDDSYPYSTMLEDRLAGKNSSWGILWWWAIFKAQGLALHPRKSLIWNGGFDNSGTHCKGPDGLEMMSPEEVLGTRFGEPIKYPDRVVADSLAFSRVKNFLAEKYSSKSPPLFSRIASAFSRLLSKKS